MTRFAVRALLLVSAAAAACASDDNSNELADHDAARAGQTADAGESGDGGATGDQGRAAGSGGSNVGFGGRAAGGSGGTGGNSSGAAAGAAGQAVYAGAAGSGGATSAAGASGSDAEREEVIIATAELSTSIDLSGDDDPASEHVKFVLALNLETPTGKDTGERCNPSYNNVGRQYPIAPGTTDTQEMDVVSDGPLDSFAQCLSMVTVADGPRARARLVFDTGAEWFTRPGNNSGEVALIEKLPLLSSELTRAVREVFKYDRSNPSAPDAFHGKWTVYGYAP